MNRSRGKCKVHHRLVTSWCLTVMRPRNVGEFARAMPPPPSVPLPSLLRDMLCISRSDACAMDCERRVDLGASTAGCIFSGDEHRRSGCRFKVERLRGYSAACTAEGSERTQSSRKPSCPVPSGPTGLHVCARVRSLHKLAPLMLYGSGGAERPTLYPAKGLMICAVGAGCDTPAIQSMFSRMLRVLTCSKLSSRSAPPHSELSRILLV
mmetsp:Transcript_18467/g.45983  ORF Transcript_18467/g.45983 Transcript_18467/m.45983 type:complete len:209 (-) Transcript_18467:614-1240(-)